MKRSRAWWLQIPLTFFCGVIVGALLVGFFPGILKLERIQEVLMKDSARSEGFEAQFDNGWEAFLKNSKQVETEENQLHQYGVIPKAPATHQDRVDALEGEFATRLSMEIATLEVRLHEMMILRSGPAN